MRPKRARSRGAFSRDEGSRSRALPGGRKSKTRSRRGDRASARFGTRSQISRAPHPPPPAPVASRPASRRSSDTRDGVAGRARRAPSLPGRVRAAPSLRPRGRAVVPRGDRPPPLAPPPSPRLVVVASGGGPTANEAGMYDGTVFFHLYPELTDPKPIFNTFLEGALHCAEVARSHPAYCSAHFHEAYDQAAAIDGAPHGYFNMSLFSCPRGALERVRGPPRVPRHRTREPGPPPPAVPRRASVSSPTDSRTARPYASRARDVCKRYRAISNRFQTGGGAVSFLPRATRPRGTDPPTEGGSYFSFSLTWATRRGTFSRVAPFITCGRGQRGRLLRRRSRRSARGRAG